MKPILPALTHPMDDDAAMWLRAIYQVETLDPKVEDAYNQLRLAANRISTPAAGHTFLYAVIAMSGVRVPEPPTTFLSYVKAGLVQMDQPLLIKFGTKWELASYRGCRGDKVTCELNGIDRTLDHTLVKFPQEELAEA